MRMSRAKESIRWAGPQDIRILASLRARQLKGTASGLTRRQRNYIQIYSAWLARMLALGSVRIAIAEDDEHRAIAVGGLLLRDAHPIPEALDDRSAYVFGMFTVVRARRRGLGMRLLQALTAEARRLGVLRVALHPTQEALGFYRMAGFRPTGELGRIIGGRRVLRIVRESKGRKRS